jgi:hypothetical protein
VRSACSALGTEPQLSRRQKTGSQHYLHATRIVCNCQLHDSAANGPTESAVSKAWSEELPRVRGITPRRDPASERRIRVAGGADAVPRTDADPPVGRCPTDRLDVGVVRADVADRFRLWVRIAPIFDFAGAAGRVKTALRCAPALRGLDPSGALPTNRQLSERRRQITLVSEE